MNLENVQPKATSHGIWWDGEYGGACKGGKFKMFYHKPNLPDIDKFDVVVCFPNASDRDEYCYVIFEGVKATLNEAHIQYLSDVVDDLFPVAGGGGGGVDPQAITGIDAGAPDQFMTITRASGRTERVNVLPTVQNSPAYVLSFNNVGRCTNMTTAVPIDQCGYPVTGYGGKNTKANRIYLPTAAFNTGGVEKGGTYRYSDNTFFVAANNVEISAQCGWLWGFHPSWPEFSKGRPMGNATSGFWVEFFNEEAGVWEDVVYLSYNHGSQGAQYPNTANPSWNCSGKSVKFAAPKAGRYRVGFVIEELGNGSLSANDFKYMRFWAYANGWGDSQKTNYWQLTGTIKDVSEGTPITPIP